MHLSILVWPRRSSRVTSRCLGPTTLPVLFRSIDCHTPHLNGVYIKMLIEPEELSSFFAFIEELPIFGLSVTAPLKEKMFPYLAGVSQEASSVGASNTLIRTYRGWEGANTDTHAAVDFLGEVEGKKVVVLGAGGAAKAIAHELVEQNAHVTIVNRTTQKALDLARQLHCSYSEYVPLYDILINATSSIDPFKPIPFISGSTVMDISIQTTPFLAEARAKGCHILDGLPMYFNQALTQQEFFRLNWS